MVDLVAAARAVSQATSARQALDEPRRASLGIHRTPAPGVAEDEQDRSEAHFPIEWRAGPEIVDKDLASLIKNYHRNGLPLVHLWQSEKNMVALGLNRHGLPGIYFTRHAQ